LFTAVFPVSSFLIFMGYIKRREEGRRRKRRGEGDK
jgi:hypothetical protein